MNLVIFDIETAPLTIDLFSESQIEYLLRNTEDNPEKKEKVLKDMAFSPLTAKIVCIGIAKACPDDDGELKIDKKIVLCNKPETDSDELRLFQTLEGKNYAIYEDSDGVVYYLSDEKWMLERFWEKAKPQYTLVSFNGRDFDAPFLMLRSALLGVRPRRNLMDGTRYNYSGHIDLLDELTFYSKSIHGATRRFNFDFYARAFGIVSPKSEGIDGRKVPEEYEKGNIYSIAKYCMRDVLATFELFKVWNKYLNFGKNG